MKIYQMHSDHGRHIAYSPQEAQSNRENGWEDVSEEIFYNVIIDDGNDLKEEYEKVFGKKPHHKMKLETIKEKLDAHRE